MKIEWNKKYTTIAIYAIIVITVSALLILGGIYLRSIGSSLSGLYKTVKPVVYGFIISYLLCPLLNLFERKVFYKLNAKKPRRKLVRTLSLICTYIIMLLFLSLFFYVMIPQIVESFNSLMKKLTDYIPSAQDYVKHLFDSSEFFQKQVEQLEEGLTGLLSKSVSLAQKITPYITDFAANFVIEMKNALIGFILSIYFLSSKEKMLAQVKKLLHGILSEKIYAKTDHIATMAHHTFGGFIIGKILDSLIIGILCLLCCFIFSIPYPPLIALIIGVTNVIPFFGPIIGAIPATFIVFIAQPHMTLVFIIIVLVLQQFDGNILGPWILGDSTGLSALWVVVAITVMGSLFGVFGLFLGVPTFAVFYAILKEWIEKRLKKKGLSVDTLDYYDHPEDIEIYKKGKRRHIPIKELLHRISHEKKK